MFSIWACHDHALFVVCHALLVVCGLSCISYYLLLMLDHFISALLADLSHFVRHDSLLLLPMVHCLLLEWCIGFLLLIMFGSLVAVAYQALLISLSCIAHYLYFWALLITFIFGHCSLAYHALLISSCI